MCFNCNWRINLGPNLRMRYPLFIKDIIVLGKSLKGEIFLNLWTFGLKFQMRWPVISVDHKDKNCKKEQYLYQISRTCGKSSIVLILGWCHYLNLERDAVYITKWSLAREMCANNFYCQCWWHKTKWFTKTWLKWVKV